jgi:hypothetical protein
MIVAANHMRDAHVHVIDDDAEVVGRIAVRACDDQIIQLRVLEHHAAVHLILDDDRAFERVLETDDRLDAGARLGRSRQRPS